LTPPGAWVKKIPGGVFYKEEPSQLYVEKALSRSLSYNIKRITKHLRIECALLFKTGAWLGGLVIQANDGLNRF